VDSIRWGVLGTSGIARQVVTATREDGDATPTRFVAVGGREPRRTAAYAQQLGLVARSYEGLLADPDVDAVYVTLPVALHVEWTLRALRAGKHVLCEKPLATSERDAVRCFDAAERAGRTLVEGYMHRLHPRTSLVRRLVAGGAVGDVTHVRAVLSVSVPATDIRRSGPLGGGAHLDLGGYCVSAVRMFAGEPDRVHAEQVADPVAAARGEDVDLRLAATLRTTAGVFGQFDVGLDLPRRDELVVVGTEGVLSVPDPWLCRPPTVELVRDGRTESVPVDPLGELGLTGEESDPYRLEFRTVSQALLAGSELEFGRADALGQARVLAAVGQARRGVPVEVVPALQEAER